jgi:sulfide dehydrogenase cytochrome subunit
MTQRSLLALALFAAAAVAHAADDASARNLAATCASCHGTEGRSASPDLPSLAGMPKEKMISAMKAFKEGKREATVMHQLARGYTERQIDLVAEYFAGRKK